jgi:hypothetical protein
MIMQQHPNYKGYFATKDGQVYSEYSNKFLKAHNQGSGYLSIMIKNNYGEFKRVLVHRFVAETFLGLSELVVNHKDGNKLNNHLDNLEFCTQKDNVRHSWEMGLCDHLSNIRSVNQKTKIGAKHHRSKRVRNNETGEIYQCIREASEKNNIKKSTLINQLKKDLTTKFSYEKQVN